MTNIAKEWARDRDKETKVDDLILLVAPLGGQFGNYETKLEWMAENVILERLI